MMKNDQIPLARHFFKLSGIGLILFILITRASFSQVVINEVCSNNGDILNDSYGDFTDWIEILNAGPDTVDLSDYCLSDEGDDLGKWCFPEYLLLPGEHLIVFASGKDITLPPLYWQTIINQGDEWKYILPDAETSADWNNPEFNDSSWLTGPSGFGYSDGDDETVLPSTISVYLRKRFYMEDTSNIEAVALHMDYDDGFVAYMNGIEIARAGMAGNPPDYNTPAMTGREAIMYTGGEPSRFNLLDPPGVLRQGDNTIAIQVHNVSETSSDLSAIPFLSVQTSLYTDSLTPEILNLTVNGFHTSFKLNVDGEWLYLTRPAGYVADSLFIPYMGLNLSFGRKDTLADQWALFEVPTPGKPNNTSWFQGYVADKPKFSVPGGRIAGIQQLLLSSTEPGDTIYYTTDGSEPDRNSFMYTGPLELYADTIIRARILKTGFVHGRIVTRTYFTGTNHGLPVVCISTDPYNLWDHNYGMYADGPYAQPDFPHHNANYWNDWEKPAHIEMYEEDGSHAFGIDAGIKIYGGWSRGHPQKSLAIYARNKYGAGKIDYQIFKDKPIHEFEAIVLRNSGNDWVGLDAWGGSHMRDVLMTKLTGDMDVEHMASRQAIVYINGEYWGVMNIREKINEHFIASNNAVEPDKIDFLEGHNSILQGSNEHYLGLIEFMETNDIGLNENYEWVKTQMNMQNFINYQLAQIYYDNRDWPGNNIKYWRPATAKGKWRWIMFDTDHGFGMWDAAKAFDNTLQFALATDGPDWPNPPWSTYMLRRLLENQEFRESFINSFADRINTNFRSDSVIGLINELENNISEEMVLHMEKWGEPPQSWDYQIEQLRYFAAQRPGAVLDHIRSTLGLSWNMHKLNISISDEAAGYVKLNSIFIKDFPWEGSYFQDVPVELTAISRPGYRFTGWTGTVGSTSPEMKHYLFTEAELIANYKSENEEIPCPVIINEIFYKPDSITDSGDWIELYNNSDQYIDVSGWILKDLFDTHAYTIKAGTILEPGEYLVICRNREAFETVYPDVNNYEGSFDFGFSSSGDMVRLYNSDTILIDSVLYGINDPWPYIPIGSGFTLALRDPDLDNSPAGSWSISNERWGTPGSDNQILPYIDPTGLEPITDRKDILYQNSPNPFSEETRIMFYSSRSQPVRISVYDLNGRPVSILADLDLDKGYHEFSWTPDDHNSGIFILRVETPASVFTKKMIRSR